MYETVHARNDPSLPMIALLKFSVAFDWLPKRQGRAHVLVYRPGCVTWVFVLKIHCNGGFYLEQADLPQVGYSHNIFTIIYYMNMNKLIFAMF